MHLDVGVAVVDELRRNLLALVHDLDRDDPARRLPFIVAPQRDDAVLDGDEVAVAEIAGRAIVGLAHVVGRVELDEARAAVAEQLQRGQTHFFLKFLLDLRHHSRARARAARLRIVRPGIGAPDRAGRDGFRASAERAAHLGANRVELRVVRRAIASVGVARVEDAQGETEGGRGSERDNQESPASKHSVPQVRQLNRLPDARGDSRAGGLTALRSRSGSRDRRGTGKG